jgi:hypothetical protein
MFIANNRVTTFETELAPAVGTCHLVATLRLGDCHFAHWTLLCFFHYVLQVQYLAY